MDKELQVSFQSGPNTLHGIQHNAGESDHAVIFLSGWSGCRLGPHRMFVKTARRLASQGLTSLRLDFAGRGDSEGDTRNASIASMTDDAIAAMDFLEESSRISTFTVLGICSGGKVAVSAAARDARITRLVLWSAEPMGTVRETSRRSRKTASVIGEYLKKLMSPRTWKRIVTGQVNTDMVRKAVVHCEQATPDERRTEDATLKTFVGYKGRVKLIYGTNDPETCMASAAYETLCRDAGIPHESHRIEGANHSFYSLESEKQVIDLTTDWLK